MKKPMLERSSVALVQDGQNMRFSDEVSVAEVTQLLSQLRRVPTVASGCAGPQSDESGMNREWPR